MINQNLISLLCHLSFYAIFLIPSVLALLVKKWKEKWFLFVVICSVLELCALILPLRLVREGDLIEVLLIALFYFFTDAWQFIPSIIPILIVVLIIKTKLNDAKINILIFILLIVEIVSIILHFNYDSWMQMI